MLQKADQVPAVVAEFIGLELDDAAMARVIEYCSRDYMSSHPHQFDDHVLRQKRESVWQLPPDGTASKAIRFSAKLSLSPALRARLDEVWADTVQKRLGFESYAAFRRSLPNSLGVTRVD
ncbi:hypothetical protein AB833_01960 [Chromatiales bacterium (ex Bugula neritina AB1)]|nr:hypothetical protein AB833_01960 [Chromatiales bacterium (ex Bugula neritina AB1)]